MDEDYGRLVAVYTRDQAFEDGTFIAIPPAVASAAGIELPLIITAGARQEFVAGGDGSEDERLLKVLAAVARAVAKAPADEVCFVVPAEELLAGRALSDVDRLIAITEPGDAGEPVLTVMLPQEM